MSEGAQAIFWGVITFSLLIVIHEGGHFLVARLFGLKVHEFMIGLPGPALRFRGRETAYGITLVPFGGYVRIAGMDPGPEDPRLPAALAFVTGNGHTTADDLAAALSIGQEDAYGLLASLADWGAVSEVPGDADVFISRFPPDRSSKPLNLLNDARRVTYRGLTLGKRLAVLSAGVVLNILLAVVVFIPVIMHFGTYTTRVSHVVPLSAADKVGIRIGDTVEAINGQPTRSWEGLLQVVARLTPGDRVIVQVERDGVEMTLRPVLTRNPASNRAFLGVAPTLEHPSVWAATQESVSYIGLTFVAITRFFNPASFREMAAQSSSIVGASYLAADAARTSAFNYATIIAMLSLSLGVMNVFPIPPLDGGKMLLEIVERLRGRPLPRRIILGLSASGAAVLLTLIGYLTYSDVLKYILK